MTLMMDIPRLYLIFLTGISLTTYVSTHPDATGSVKVSSEKDNITISTLSQKNTTQTVSQSTKENVERSTPVTESTKTSSTIPGTTDNSTKSQSNKTYEVTAKNAASEGNSMSIAGNKVTSSSNPTGRPSFSKKSLPSYWLYFLVMGIILLVIGYTVFKKYRRQPSEGPKYSLLVSSSKDA